MSPGQWEKRNTNAQKQDPHRLVAAHVHHALLPRRERDDELTGRHLRAVRELLVSAVQRGRTVTSRLAVHLVSFVSTSFVVACPILYF